MPRRRRRARYIFNRQNDYLLGEEICRIILQRELPENIAKEVAFPLELLEKIVEAENELSIDAQGENVNNLPSFFLLLNVINTNVRLPYTPAVNGCSTNRYWRTCLPSLLNLSYTSY